MSLTSAADTPTLHAIVLAAGGSSRFGEPKQLVRIEGRPLLHSAVSRAVDVVGHAVIVVLGSHASEMAPLLRHTPASVAVNREWEEGIGSSIRAGVAQVPGTADGILILLADQPSVTVEDLRRLVGTWRRQPDSIVAAQYAGISGVPAIFPRWAFRALADLRGDRGAQVLFHRYQDQVVRLHMPSAALDIDRPEDLLAVEAKVRKGSQP